MDDLGVLLSCFWHQGKNEIGNTQLRRRSARFSHIRLHTDTKFSTHIELIFWFSLKFSRFVASNVGRKEYLKIILKCSKITTNSYSSLVWFRSYYFFVSMFSIDLWEKQIKSCELHTTTATHRRHAAMLSFFHLCFSAVALHIYMWLQAHTHAYANTQTYIQYTYNMYISMHMEQTSTRFASGLWWLRRRRCRWSFDYRSVRRVDSLGQFGLNIWIDFRTKFMETNRADYFWI